MPVPQPVARGSNERPQLFKVLRAETSLVASLPPLVSEFERYDNDMHGRFPVK